MNFIIRYKGKNSIKDFSLTYNYFKKDNGTSLPINF